MKKLLFSGLLLALSLPAVAQSAFDGTWKFHLNDAQFPKKPDVYVLKDGMYHCKTCAPPINIKADGEDQPVTGYPYFDTMSVKVVDDHTIESVIKKNGKTVGTTKTVVSQDGKTSNFEFTDSSNTSAEPVNGKGMSKRVAQGPAGSHAVSGSWVMAKMDDLSENGLLMTYKLEGDSLTMSTPTGQSYTAKLDGTEAPYKGDPGITSVVVKKLGNNTIEETDKRNGKVISVARLTVDADGKTMHVKVDDKMHGAQAAFTASKMEQVATQ